MGKRRRKPETREVVAICNHLIFFFSIRSSGIIKPLLINFSFSGNIYDVDPVNPARPVKSIGFLFNRGRKTQTVIAAR
jgi:hypothetical protein